MPSSSSSCCLPWPEFHSHLRPLITATITRYPSASKGLCWLAIKPHGPMQCWLTAPASLTHTLLLSTPSHLIPLLVLRWPCRAPGKPRASPWCPKHCSNSVPYNIPPSSSCCAADGISLPPRPTPHTDFRCSFFLAAARAGCQECRSASTATITRYPNARRGLCWLDMNLIDQGSAEARPS